MKIYTRTGDKGQTSLFGGKRVSKSDIRVEAYGTIDELNSMLGIVVSQISNHKSQITKVKKELEIIQQDLFAIGSYLASPEIKDQRLKIKDLPKRVEEFEKLIDRLTEKLPKLQNFILPGGGRAGAQLHLARTVCRRTERRIIALSKKESVDTGVIMYFNRLSDLLFTMARYMNHIEKKKETIWSS